MRKTTIFTGLLFAVISTTVAFSTRTNKSASSPVTSAPTRSKRCPRACQCTPSTMTVECAYQNLYRVPYGIPKWTRTLILTGNRISVLPNKTFRRLVHLEDLEVDGNEIETISDRVIRKLRKLRKLNLSSNKLESISPASLNKLGQLETLLVNNNKLGKLSISTFSGLQRVTEIDLSNNLLQTLEVEMFENLHELKEVYFHGNRWHCDCQLKNVELSLRNRNIRTGYMVCDSPSALTKHHLRDVASSSVCGPDSQRLISILLGVFSGLVTVLFAIFMCRRRTAKGIEASETAASDKAAVAESEVHADDTFSRCSIISEESNRSDLFVAADLLGSPIEIRADVLKPSPAFEDSDDSSSESDLESVSSRPPPYEHDLKTSTDDAMKEK
ncbi:uncharacterized protein LOC101243539 [Ciona intestinalis]